MNEIFNEEELVQETEAFKVGDMIFVDFDENGKKTSGKIEDGKLGNHQSVFRCDEIRNEGRRNIPYFKCLRYKGNDVDVDELFPKAYKSELQYFYGNPLSKSIPSLNTLLGMKFGGLTIGNFTVFNDGTVERKDAEGNVVERKDIGENRLYKTLNNAKHTDSTKYRIENCSTIDELLKEFPSINDKREKRYQETYRRLKDAYSDDFDMEFGGSNKPSIDELTDFEKRHRETNNRGRELEEIVAKTLDSNLDPEQNSELKTNDDKKTASAIQTGDNPDISDVEVTLKDKDKFFIEVKLDYDSAPITHLGVTIRNGVINILDRNRVENKLHGNDSDLLRSFTDSLNGKEEKSLTDIIQKSEQLKVFYRRFNNFVSNLENRDFNLPFQRGRIKFENDATFPEKFKQMANECQRFITYYETKYRELLTTFSKLNKKRDEKEQEEIVKTIQEKFPLNEMTDDESLQKDESVIRYISEIDDRDHAINILVNIRKIHNKLTTILNDADKNSLESLTEADKAKFIFWTFLASSRNDRIKKDEIVLFDKVIDQTDYARRLAKIEVTKQEDLRTIGEMISRYYRGLGDVAYVQIGNDTYYLEKKFDPLNIIESNGIQDIRDSFSKATIALNLNESLTKIQMVINLYPIKGNGKYFGFFGDDEKTENSKKQIRDIDLTKGDENLQSDSADERREIEEHVNRILNESVNEGIPTAETEANKYEIQVAQGIGDFLASQKSPYNTLSVSHYEESDLKYHSDIFVTGLEKTTWIEAKKNKYANLGSSSWKYEDGNWTCTTLGDDDPFLPILKQSIETEGRKFVDFCKSYLKTDELRLPTDITPELIDAWKASGSVDDTDNDVQFITNKVQIDDFGQRIAEYYKTAKEEPATYMHVGDDLYIVDRNINDWHLKTKDGRELKSLEEAYRIGRIQFRAKGYDRPQKYYYSIYCDVKILADKDNLDEEYSCSFLDQTKWPVIVEDGGESNSDEMDELTEHIERICGEGKSEENSTNPTSKMKHCEQYRFDETVFEKCAERMLNNLQNKSLRECIGEEGTHYLCDSIIKTYPTKKFLETLVKRFYDTLGLFGYVAFVENDGYRIEYDGKGISYGDSDFDDKFEFQAYSTNQEDDIDGTLEFSFKVNGEKAKNIRNEKFMAKLIGDCHYFGYDMVNYTARDIGVEVEFHFLFESKYQPNDIEVNEKLYHLSPFRNNEKILSRGIFPKSDSENKGLRLNHEPRTYLFNSYDQKLFEKFLGMLGKKNETHVMGEIFSRDEVFGIYEIDVEKTNGLHFYRDNMFYTKDMKNPIALYVYEPIPPTAIKLVGKIDLEGNLEQEDELEIREQLEKIYSESEQNSVSDMKLLTNVPEDNVKNILDTAKIENHRFQREQFEKYYGHGCNWVCLMNSEECLAIAALEENRPFDSYAYIAEIQTLRKGYGRYLIEEIVNSYGKVWLMANTKAGESLINYYRNLNLQEITVENSVYGCTAYFFCTKDCDYDKLENYLIAFYSNEEEELDEAEEDIGGDKSEIADEIHGLKIWIDDIREAPQGFKWFKKTRDFIDYVQEHGTEGIELIDTDHDAGDYQKFGGDYIRCFDYLDYIGAKNITVHIHSANPVGANNIRRIISKNKEENNWREVRNT